MKYICQIFLDESRMAAMPQPEVEAINAEHHEYDDELVQSGHMIFTGALQPSHAAACVRILSGKIAVTDGPFAETKEQVAGFFLIEARDLNEAIQVASRIPAARLGAVEVRALAPLTIGGEEYWCMDRLAAKAGYRTQ
ncbi:MAG: YciI family protein [Usitatibacter sp.]